MPADFQISQRAAALSPLSRRLGAVAQSPGRRWRLLTENVPVWPEPPVASRGRDHGEERYAPSQGLEVLLDALCDAHCRHGVDIGSDSLLVTNGAFDALCLSARHLVRRGFNRVLCAGPVVVNVAKLLRDAGLHVVAEPWIEVIDARRRRTLEIGDTDILYLNTPHNPTGACIDRPAAEALLADQHQIGFAVVFDLAYDSFVREPALTPSPLSLVEDWSGVFGLSSFSKNYGVPGLRVGWLTAEPATVAELTACLEAERISVATGAQLRAAELHELGNAPLRERVEHGHRLVGDWARQYDIEAAAPRGGTQAWLDLGVGDSERFADMLMAEADLVLTTGANYFPQDGSRVRIPTGIPSGELLEALELIASVREQVLGSAA